MLQGTGPRGGAWGFKLEVLTKLSDTKTTDGKRCVCACVCVWMCVCVQYNIYIQYIVL